MVYGVFRSVCVYYIEILTRQALVLFVMLLLVSMFSMYFLFTCLHTKPVKYV